VPARPARPPKGPSAGQTQLLALGGALGRRPGLFIADGPTAYLDARNARRVSDHLLEDAGHRLVLVTHELELAARCDTAVLFAGGTVSVTLTCTADLSGLTLAGVPGSATMTATGAAPLETYRQFSVGLSNSEAAAPVPWRILADQTPGAGALIPLIDPGAAALPRRFYRATVQP